MDLKKRSEMNKEYMWDVSHIFETKEKWEEALKSASEKIAILKDLKGTLCESAASLKSAFDKTYDTIYETELVYLYASLLKSSDNGDSEYQEMEGKAITLYVSLQTALAFFDPELLSMSEEKAKEFLECEELKNYRHILEDTLRGKPHVLSEECETMLAKLSDAASTPDNAFEMLESVDMIFPKITDENGEEHQLTHGNFMVFRESKSADVRKDAFEKYFGEFKKYVNTFAAMYAGNVKFDNYFADVKHFDSALSKALFSSNVPTKVYDSLVEAIHEGLPIMKDYLSLRKKALGLEKLSMYDLYCPMIEDVDFEIPYEEAQTLVLEATKPLGEEYQKLLKKAFSEKWIDVYENHGKTTGAFSCGVYGVHPYVLLNYTNTLDDAFTVAHELGHAMHSYLSAQANDFANSDYKILVAEVASTVNEVLLTKYLLKKETDKKRRAYILNHFLEGFRTTVYRQTLFAEFERKAHEMQQSGETLTAKSLSKVYRDLNLLYYDGAEVPEIQDYEWARIPHFYRAYYVYQYATGFCSAVAIANKILETNDASDYLKFLSTGGSDYPINELKIAGVDLTDPKSISYALSVFRESLNELSEII